MKAIPTLSLAVILLLCVAPVVHGRQGRGGGGGGSSSMGGAPIDPTPFEQFVAKLKLDSKKQLPKVVEIFTAAAAEAAPISQDLIRLRAQMVEFEGKPDQLAPVMAAFNAASARMVAAEVKAFKQVQALLTPSQLSKSAEAFVLMAGIFNPPTPSGSRSMRRGGGGQ
jgi:hypothetical protein